MITILKGIVSHALRTQAVAILSLIVAVTALSYNSNRNALTEKNRNIRIAEFEILRNLAELQEMIEISHFQAGTAKANRSFALSRVLVIRDLSLISPEPVPAAAEKLMAVWRVHGDKLDTSIDAAQVLSEQVLQARQVVVASLRSLK